MMLSTALVFGGCNGSNEEASDDELVDSFLNGTSGNGSEMIEEEMPYSEGPDKPPVIEDEA